MRFFIITIAAIVSAAVAVPAPQTDTFGCSRGACETGLAAAGYSCKRAISGRPARTRPNMYECATLYGDSFMSRIRGCEDCFQQYVPTSNATDSRYWD